MKIFFKQMLTISAFYFEKQSVLSLRKGKFLGHYQYQNIEHCLLTQFSVELLALPRSLLLKAACTQIQMYSKTPILSVYLYVTLQ